MYLRYAVNIRTVIQQHSYKPYSVSLTLLVALHHHQRGKVAL